MAVVRRGEEEAESKGQGWQERCCSDAAPWSACQSSQPSVLFTALVTPPPPRPKTPFVPVYFNAPLPLFLHGYGHNHSSTLSSGWLRIK